LVANSPDRRAQSATEDVPLDDTGGELQAIFALTPCALEGLSSLSETLATMYVLLPPEGEPIGMLSRRALFTQPKSGSGSRSGAEPRPPAPGETPVPGSFDASAGYWLHLSRMAMACKFEITLPGELSQHLDAANAALDGIDALEAQLTIFRETSELAAINRDAATAPVPVETHLFTLLELCQRLHRETGGAFDITSTPLSRIWGFLRRAGRLPAPDELASTLADVGMEKVELAATADVKTVRFSRPCISLNLGGVGKGYALDRVAKDLYQAGVDTALLSAGSSSLRAIGAGPDGAGYRVGIRDPFDHKRRYGTVTLRNDALGVSGAGEQFFEVEGRRYGHIIDPRSGWPVEGRALVAVTAPTGTLADALATAFFVGGRALAERYIQHHPEVGVVLLDMPLPGRRPEAVVLGRNTQWRVNRAA
jgi:thiamine biosynthesis lipoprotein